MIRIFGFPFGMSLSKVKDVRSLHPCEHCIVRVCTVLFYDDDRRGTAGGQARDRRSRKKFGAFPEDRGTKQRLHETKQLDIGFGQNSGKSYVNVGYCRGGG
jgi:hypothetical protein